MTARTIAESYGYHWLYLDGRRNATTQNIVDAIRAAQIDALQFALNCAAGRCGPYVAHVADKIAELEREGS